MNQHRRLLIKLQRRYLVKSLLFCIIACGITIAIFSPVGLVRQYLNIDLTFVLLPFLGYFMLNLISKQIGVTIFPAEGELFACILNGIAPAFLVYFFFSQAQLLTRIPLLAGSRTFLDSLAHISVFLIVIIAGNTILKLAGVVKYVLRRENISPIFSMTGWVLIGLGLWQSLSVFSKLWPPFNGIGLVIFIGIAVLAISYLGVYGVPSKNLLISDASQWLSSGLGEKFLVAGLIAAYIIFMRKALFTYVSTGYLVEWLLFCILSWRIFESIKKRLEKHHIVPIKENDWHKHKQRIDDLTDEDFSKLVILQEDYVAGGSRREILQYLRQLLIQNGHNEEDISDILHPIIEHSDRKTPWYAFGYLKRRILRRNRLRRRKSLDDTIKQLAVT
jgi:hypothetical protein